MQELAQVSLENEMDLILSHRRSIRLAEITGLSLSAQTTFATAVSELARGVIDEKEKGLLTLGIESDKRDHYIVARLRQPHPGRTFNNAGLAHARKLVSNVETKTIKEETQVDLYYHVQLSYRVDIHKLDEWRALFRREPPMSAYEELKRNHEHLRELSEQLQRSEAQYRTLAGALPMIIFSLDSSGKLIYANEWLEKFTGLSLEKLNAGAWQTVIHPDDYPAFSAFLSGERSRAAGMIQSRIRHFRSDDFLWQQVSLTPMYNEQQPLQYWIGYMVDIDKQKAFEETLRSNIELRESQERMERNQHALEQYIERLNVSNQELQEFAYIASHDLQEPTRKVLYYSDRVLNKYGDTLQPEVSDAVEKIQTASQRMRELISDLLSYAQLNGSEPERTQVNLQSLAESALADLEPDVRTSGAAIRIEQLPLVTGDENMLRRLFGNIIHNAIKYARTGIAPEIGIDANSSGHAVTIRFTDNGIGFEQVYADRIFQLFQRLHTREVFSGTGVGLAICKRIAEAHGGTITATSVPGQGSVFTVTLPQTNAHENR